MPYCAITSCRNTSRTKTMSQGGISYHRFPKNPGTKEQWVEKTGRENWIPQPYSTICSDHFLESDINTTKNGKRFVKASAIPTQKIVMSTNEAGQPIPSPSVESNSKTRQNDQDNSDTNLSTPEPDEPQDPLKKGTLEQCRFCGEFRKDCIDLTTAPKPYLERYKTSLTVNSLNIELDFNDDTLPKTVCCNCDGKLQEMTDFVKKVIDAQDSLINVADVVKVEAETTEDNDYNDDPLELSEVFTHKMKKPEPKQKRKAKQSDNSELDQQDETDDTAQGNSVSKNTVFTHKRKNVTKENAAKRKIFKIDIPIQRKIVEHDQRDNFQLIDAQGNNVSNITCEDTDLITDIKQENIETGDSHEEVHLELEEVDNKPDEAEIASNALVYEMSKS